MFKNFPKYITLILTITTLFTLLCYSIFSNPFQFDKELHYWIIRILTYILFAYWLISLGEKKGIRTELVFLSIIIAIIPFLSTDNRIAYNLIPIQDYINVICVGTFSITSIWIIFYLFKNKTLLGFLLVLNTILTIFIMLPYGIPKLENFGTNYSCQPFYILNDYSPFEHRDLGSFAVFLDIRFLSSIIFSLYIIILSFSQTVRISYEDNYGEKILYTENSIVQFLQAGVYFTWKIIQRIIFFGRNFLKAIVFNIWNQIKKSIRSYIIAITILSAFIIPKLIMNISVNTYNNIQYSKISIPSFEQIVLVILLSVLVLIPIILVKLLKSNFEPFQMHKLNAFERPALFTPIYIILFSLGLTSLINGFWERHYGNYFIFFSGVLIYAATWGFIKHRKGIRNNNS
nr:hypothetical protein [uncultured Draconibacterium sp.]